MSAFEPGLMAQLAAAVSPMEKSLWQIVGIYRESDNIQCNEIRVFEIAMTGLGFCSRQRRLEVQAAIQRRRDRVMALPAVEEGSTNAPP